MFVQPQYWVFPVLSTGSLTTREATDHAPQEPQKLENMKKETAPLDSREGFLEEE